jgi:small subunit ribosomal protein S21
MSLLEIDDTEPPRTRPSVFRQTGHIGPIRVLVGDQGMDQALRDFKNRVAREGVLSDVRRRSRYTPPGEARRAKSSRARRRRTR